MHQPSGAVETVEALVRWQHPTRGLLGPDHFVPVAEQTGLVDEPTRWVLDEALEELGRLSVDAPGLTVAVNVSARSLQRAEFPSVVLDALARADVAPCRLLLEITETALVTDAVQATAVLAEPARRRPATQPRRLRAGVHQPRPPARPPAQRA
nr:EAL domain-containing protein [Angustibacter aerolatus]